MIFDKSEIEVRLDLSVNRCEFENDNSQPGTVARPARLVVPGRARHRRSLPRDVRQRGLGRAAASRRDLGGLSADALLGRLHLVPAAGWKSEFELRFAVRLGGDRSCGDYVRRRLLTTCR